MAIAQYIKEIGRGKQGARALSRVQAADLMGQILDGHATDLEVGAFCLAMRIKGETAEEMAGFLDATHERLARIPHTDTMPIVVLPSYNGARKLPVLTPLLAGLLAQQGLPVLVHGCSTEDQRVPSAAVLQAMGIAPLSQIRAVQAGEVAFVPTGLLCPALQRLLDVRRVVGLRNPAHSLVKLMSPVQGPCFRVASYTHPEYASAMGQTLALLQADALLLRGTEGEVVADARRLPSFEWWRHGQLHSTQAATVGSLTQTPALPQIGAEETAAYIQAVLRGDLPAPAPIATQVQGITQACLALHGGHT